MQFFVRDRVSAYKVIANLVAVSGAKIGFGAQFQFVMSRQVAVFGAETSFVFVTKSVPVFGHEASSNF